MFLQIHYFLREGTEGEGNIMSVTQELDEVRKMISSKLSCTCILDGNSEHVVNG